MIMELFTKDNGKKSSDMDMESKFGQMELNTKGTGLIMLQMVKGSFGIQMVTSMMENGRMIRLMALVPTLI